jgi:hypothetical protein
MSLRLAFAAPHLTLDPDRAPFFRGADERDGVTEVSCPRCDAPVFLHAQRFSARADRWHDALPEALQEAASALFGLRREAPTERWPGRLPLGRRPSIGPLRCATCQHIQLACIDLHEQQPGLSVATLQGLASAADDHRRAVTPLLPIDGLRLVLPLADGDLLLDFILDGPRRLDADALARIAPGVFRGEPGMTRLDGIRGADGTWIDPDTLRARSSRPAGIDPNTWLLTLGSLAIAPTPDDPALSSLAVHWLPLRRGREIRMEETRGGGFFLHRDQSDLPLGLATSAASYRALIEEAGAAQWLASAEGIEDEHERRHRLAAATVGLGAHHEAPRRLPLAPRPLPMPPADAAPGWWTDPEGETTQWIVDATDEHTLAAAVATVAARMRERRDADGAVGERRLSVIAFAKARRIELCWVDPVRQASLGQRRYAVVPRRFATEVSEDGLEYAAERWAARLAADPAFQDVDVFHRFQFAGRWSALGKTAVPGA